MNKKNMFISLPKDLAEKVRVLSSKNGQTLSGFFRIAAEEKLLRDGSNEN